MEVPIRPVPLRAEYRRPNQTWMNWVKKRYVVTFLAFLGFFFMSMLKTNMIMTIIAMNSPYNVTLGNGTVIEKEGLDWNFETRAVVLIYSFYGFILTQVIGGWLGAHIGGSRVYGVGVAASAIINFITPLIAYNSIYLLVVVRFVQGLFEGAAYPCMHAVWARWAPPQERSFLPSIAFSGSYLSSAFVVLVFGPIINILSWHAIYYISGFFGLVWCAIWWIIVKDNPQNDPHISPEELKYLKDSLGNTESGMMTHPWCRFLSSMPVWSIVAAYFCATWGFSMLVAQLPVFLREVFHFRLESRFIFALPYLAMAIVIQFAGGLADLLRNNNVLTTTQVRKVFVCGAFVSQAVLIVVVGHVKSALAVIACVVIAVGLGAFAWSAFSVNHLDIAPQHASVLLGVSNTFASLSGVIAPIFTVYFTWDETAEGWQFVFYITSGIYLMGALIYGVFASGEKQHWAMNNSSSRRTQQQLPSVQQSLI